MSIGIGIGFSGWPFGDTNPEAFWNAVDLAESLAIDSLWLSDRVVVRGPEPGARGGPFVGGRAHPQDEVRHQRAGPAA